MFDSDFACPLSLLFACDWFSLLSWVRLTFLEHLPLLCFLSFLFKDLTLLAAIVCASQTVIVLSLHSDQLNRLPPISFPPFS